MKKTFVFWIPIFGLAVPISITISEKDALNKKKVPLTSAQLRTTAEILMWIADVKDGTV